MKILSVDFGTSSVKMAVLTDREEILQDTKEEYQYQVIDKHKIQIDPEVMYAAFLKGLKKFSHHLKDIDLVVPCVFAPVFIPLDRDGRALHPAIIHLDRRSYAQSRFALKAVGKKDFMAINGNLPFAGGISCTSMLWYKDKLPELYRRTWKLGHMNTFLQRRLTGRWLIDPSNASFTGLYETLQMGSWSEKICSALGIHRDLLPEIVPSISIAGPLTREAAGDTGLRQGIPVAMGANDTTSAAFGAGAVNTGDILNISGSNEIITVTTDAPVPHEKYYIRASMEPGKWLYLAITVGGFALEWFRKEFYSEMDKKDFYGGFLSDFVKTRTRTDVVFKPYLAGDRHSLVKKKGAFTGLTFESTREDLLLGLLVGTFEPVFSTINILKKRMRLNPHIFWTGGMVGDAYQDFKRRIFKGFDFNMRRECSTLGNLQVARRLINGR